MTRTRIGSSAICMHGADGIVEHVYAYSGDIELSVDESHADMFGTHICYVRMLADFHPSFSAFNAALTN